MTLKDLYDSNLDMFPDTFVDISLHNQHSDRMYLEDKRILDEIQHIPGRYMRLEVKTFVRHPFKPNHYLISLWRD